MPSREKIFACDTCNKTGTHSVFALHGDLYTASLGTVCNECYNNRCLMCKKDFRKNVPKAAKYKNICEACCQENKDSINPCYTCSTVMFAELQGWFCEECGNNFCDSENMKFDEDDEDTMYCDGCVKAGLVKNKLIIL